MGAPPTLDDLLDALHHRQSTRLPGFKGDTCVDRAMPLADAGPDSVSFCRSTLERPESVLAKTHAALLIVDESIPIDLDLLAKAGVQAVARSPNARLDFIRLLRRFFVKPHPGGIHHTAVISPDARIGSDVSIGAYAVIGEATIGEGSRIGSGVRVYDGVSIGRNVTVHSGGVIGSHGFGYERNETGELERFPHLGGLIIEDDVDIHSNVNVDRGTLGDTVIGRGTKIDKFCHIGHNVVVGKHCVITAHCLVAGHAHIGDYVWMAPCVCVRSGGIAIGDGAFVGMATVVTKDVPANVTVMGAPARPVEDYKRMLRALSAIADEQD